jgi:hypothetical protein
MVREIPPDQHGQLLAELRSEIDNIEQVIERRATLGVGGRAS